MPKLSDAQAALLTAAAVRPDLNIFPVPETVRLRGAALDRTLRALLSRGLIRESGMSGGRKRQKPGTHALLIAPAGLAAIGVEAPEARPNETGDAPVPKTRPGGKLGVLLDAVARPGGATLDDLVATLGWLPRTTRAALVRLRQRGFDVRLADMGGRRAYRLAPAA
ncbi:DUF3489 domain-containing protein [Amaricoccus solimangrovi]|uniref:DUF3489 domain-containing protein n=1 Tax=Amaricoccus solimangrovi TaxID=2589815 RepID=A0A501WLC9_9RHOB|nr:DUF3489 domain-containing protein [Amaricoccus solimangrovi]TPE48944.1 DUF3489 domain-containing protein [Amaricoccus solimangrovi]